MHLHHKISIWSPMHGYAIALALNLRFIMGLYGEPLLGRGTLTTPLLQNNILLILSQISSLLVSHFTVGVPSDSQP